ncbi:MAG: FecR family protein [Pseudomonadota bacterium]
MRSSASITALLSGISLLALSTAAPAQDIGNVAAVNQDMQGTQPGGAPRQLEIREAVVENERIQTSDDGSGQLVFVDQTTLTVSSKSDITLDQYIFDAAADQGDMALTMTRGAMRFIGGRISKKRRAVVRTPTATIGIRGGLVIIQVADDGSTRVTQLAGESTTVVSYGDADNDGVDDGPTGGEKESFQAGEPVGNENAVVLSRAGATAESFPSDITDPVFDGTGFDDSDDGSASDESTTGDDGSGDGGDSRVVYAGVAETDDLKEIYEDFEGKGSGGISSRPTNEAVQRSTNEVAQVNSGIEGGSERNPVSTSGESPVESSDPNAPVENPINEVPLVERENQEALTGIDFGDPEPDPEPPVVPPVVPPIEPPIEPPVAGPIPPSGGAILFGESGISPFSEVLLGSLIGILETPIEGVESVQLDVPLTPDNLLPTHPLLNVGYFAQTRFPNSGFFDVAVIGQPGNIEAFAPGFIVFNNDNNIEFAVGEILAEDGIVPVIFGNPTPNQQNAFANDPAAGANGNSSTSFISEPLIANGAGEEPVEVAIISNGSSGGDGGRFFFAELSDDSDSSQRELIVAAGALTRDEGGPDFNLTAQSSTTTEFGPGQVEVGYEISRLTAVEDAEGNSFFGPDHDFLVLASPEEAGFETIQPFNGQTFTDQLDPNVVLLTRNPAGKEIDPNPLALANDNSSRATPTLGVFDSVLATGFATCGNSRSCSTESNVYALRPEPLVTLGELSTSGQFDFQPGGLDNNSVLSFFALDDNGLSNVQTGQNGLPTQFLFTANATDSAYFNDQVFGASSQNSTAILAGNDQGADVIIASAEAVAAAEVLNFPAGINPTPLFARWGFWAASFDVVENGGQVFDTDIVDLGTFVTGVRPNPTDFQNFTGTAGFEGPVVATMQDLNVRNQSQLVTGQFDLSYDFDAAQGSFILEVPAAGVNQTLTVNQTGTVASPSYGGQFLDTQFNTRVDGVFYSGGGDIVAGTGGIVDVTDSFNGSRTLGIFAGDKK